MVACGIVQGFATSLLDVADNLGRAVESVRKSANVDEDEVNPKVLQSLLEGVEMTDKQLMQVFLCPPVLRLSLLQCLGNSYGHCNLIINSSHLLIFGPIPHDHKSL